MSKKLKVLFIGDNHCTSKQPPKRLDDYCETSAQEFFECLQIAKKYNVDAAVFLGDIFDKNIVKPTIVSKLLAALRQDEDGKPWPFPSYCVIGNHDIAHNVANLPTSSLQTLISSGLIICQESIEELGIYCGHFYPKLDQDIRDGKLKNVNFPVLALHASIMTQPARDFEGVIFKDTKFHPMTKLVVSGHIHSPMEQKREDDILFINPGSVGRYSMQNDLINRDIKVVIVDYDLDGNIYNHEYVKLKTSLPAEMIFDFSEKEESKKQIKIKSEYIRKLADIDSDKFKLINDPIEMVKKYSKDNSHDEEVTNLLIDRLRDKLMTEE